ncbi:unnamed protein product [Tuber melanosporum]|uniref:(Perigord truffle) hypothetical protein n=1 Tax=Tuber melanosporum (strain Mel28) TaxID=656061 RepID=D5G6S3_TUBMM|nr:uncharacterized protein GSTUM_00002245001 [Tuber melanosporum]CAZ80216.1 unnamed protein product [Tuber melanosporum]
MDILGRHRIAFNNLGVQLFADLERDLAPVLTKGLGEKADLERVIAEQKELLQERQALVDAYQSASEQQQQKIREQENRLQSLGYGIAKTEIENEALVERLEEIEKADRERQRRALAITKDKSLENKENIPPVFNYLAQNTPSRTLTRPVSPPPKPLNKPRIPSSTPAGGATRTLFSYKDGEVQTDPIYSLDDLKKAYQELASSYNDIHYELDQYKEAYSRLAEKYAQNKAVWKQWSEQENTRLINSKKRRLEEGTTELRAVGRRINGYTTPATSITGGSPTSRAPNISPIKPRFRPSVVHSSPKNGGLFHELLESGAGMAGEVKGSFELVGGKGLVGGGPKEGSVELPSSPLSSPPSSLSTPETQVPSRTLGATRNSKSRDDGDSTESDDEPRPSNRCNDALESVIPSRDSAFKIPVVKEETGACGRGRISQEGDSMARPVVIKSESHTSSEGLGYHMFDQESLDLDDIGQKPQTPRKRQKPRYPELGASENIGRLGWISGGFRIAPTGDTGEAQDAENDLPVPIFPPSAVGEGKPVGIWPDSQLVRPTTPVQTAGAGPRSSFPISAENEGSKTHPPLRRSSRTSATRKTLSPTTKAKKLNAHSPPKAKKRRMATSRAIASLAEDGTDGCEDINTSSIHPPMVLSEKQRKQLERDMKGTTRLDDILNSPASRTPNLARLKKSIQSRTSPVRKRTWGGDGFGAPQVRPPSSAGPSTSAWRAGGNMKSKARDISSTLDISDFRVNPEVNDGKDYAFAETVRNRDARKCLPGCMKTCCRDLVGFTEAAGLPAVSKGPRWRSSSPAPVDGCDLPRRNPRKESVSREDKAKEFTNRYGRHRDAFERRRSPPGFWDADFPTTPELEQQRVVAEEMRRKKVEDMRKEAGKGNKGRYVYRD